ncbi:MAG: glucosaminidase domain-containing protein [Pseudomonadales bacterium]
MKWLNWTQLQTGWSKAKWSEIAVLPIIIAFVGIILLVEHPESPLPEEIVIWEEPEHIPDFNAYTNVQEKKTAFFEFMLPMIRKANASIMEERTQLKNFLTRLSEGKGLSTNDKEKVATLFKKYNMNVPETITANDLQKLLVRVDFVPASLVLAQAANESAWGTSRFAKNANNFFGIWCYVPGCGLTPGRRDQGKTHEVRKYDSIQAGVNDYLRLINTQRAYRELRQLRAELRDENNINGIALAEGLIRYSERGHEYVNEVKQMIRYNKLQRYTKDHSA